MLNRNRHKSKHLAHNHPRKEASPIRRPKTKHCSPARCAHVKKTTRVQLPALQAPTRGSPGEENILLKNSGDRYKRHATRIDRVSVTSAVTFTRISAHTRVGAIDHLQILCPRILKDWVASPLRETQPRPRPRSGKFQPRRTVFTEHTFAVGKRRYGVRARCPRRNNPCQNVYLHGKSGSVGAPNPLCPQPETRITNFVSSSQCSTGSLSRWSPPRGSRH